MMRDGARTLLATLEMLSDLGCDDIRAGCPGGFQTGTDSRMAQRASRRRQPLVQELAVEIVPEGVMLGRRPVRPAARTGLDDEHALPSQARAGGFDGLDIGSKRGGDGRSRELAADDTRRGQ